MEERIAKVDSSLEVAAVQTFGFPYMVVPSYQFAVAGTYWYYSEDMIVADHIFVAAYTELVVAAAVVDIAVVQAADLDS